MATRSLGAASGLALAVQAATTLACAHATWRLWSADEGPAVRLAGTIGLTLLASPWVHLYDWPLLSAAVVLLLPRAHGVQRWLLGFAWLWPAVAMLVPSSPVISVLAVVAVVVVALRSEPVRFAQPRFA